VGLALVGLSALYAATQLNIAKAKEIEDAMYNARVATGELVPDEHKRSGHSTESAEEASESGSAKK
jgi:hypothetical protein